MRVVLQGLMHVIMNENQLLMLHYGRWTLPWNFLNLHVYRL